MERKNVWNGEGMDEEKKPFPASKGKCDLVKELRFVQLWRMSPDKCNSCWTIDPDISFHAISSLW